jgi:hypothetical protein
MIGWVWNWRTALMAAVFSTLKRKSPGSCDLTGIAFCLEMGIPPDRKEVRSISPSPWAIASSLAGNNSDFPAFFMKTLLLTG